MIIENGKTYRIKGKSTYLAKKYGTSNPLIRIEDLDRKLWPDGWEIQAGNPACILYGIRVGLEGLPLGGDVYYGKIEGLGELVHETELEEVPAEKKKEEKGLPHSEVDCFNHPDNPPIDSESE